MRKNQNGSKISKMHGWKGTCLISKEDQIDQRLCVGALATICHVDVCYILELGKPTFIRSHGHLVGILLRGLTEAVSFTALNNTTAINDCS